MSTEQVTAVPPGTIVVGVDGSPLATQALAWAAEQAKLEGRALTLAHGTSVQTSAWVLGQPGLDPVVLSEAIRTEGHGILDAARELVARRAPDVEVHEVMLLSDPRQLLLELAPRAAMIVLGSRGRGPVASLLLGSVGVTVSRHAPCPVVIYRPHQPGDVRRGILVGFDGTGDSEAAVEWAYHQASVRDLPLTVMHVFWDATTAGHGYLPVSDSEEGLEDIRLMVSEAISGLGEKYPDVHASVKLARGFADDALVTASENMHMVVVGTDPRTPVAGRVFGGVASSVTEHAHCLVALVPSS